MKRKGYKRLKPVGVRGIKKMGGFGFSKDPKARVTQRSIGLIMPVLVNKMLEILMKAMNEKTS
jgi:hypothetical protein